MRRTPPDGLVAEWLRRGLQILVRGFDSLRGLHKKRPSKSVDVQKLPENSQLFRIGWEAPRVMRLRRKTGAPSLRRSRSSCRQLAKIDKEPLGSKAPVARDRVQRLRRRPSRSPLCSAPWSKPRRATLNDRGAKTSPIIALARSGGGATGAMGEAGTRLVQPSAGRGRDVLAERPCIKVLQKLPQGASPSQKLSHGHAGLSFFVFADSGTEEPMPKRHSNNKINQELF